MSDETNACTVGDNGDTTMTNHSKIVGGSTAKRVINCPGSVRLVAQMPPSLPSSYADEGTLLHDVIAHILNFDVPADALLGKRVGDAVLTDDLIDTKIAPALALLDEVSNAMHYEVEQRVHFGELLPGVFGSVDLIGRDGNRAIVLDWKFGSGVMVEAEENEQLLFYGAAARISQPWAFAGVTEVELFIIQPPAIRRWTTTLARLDAFVSDLVAAVRRSERDDAPLAMGDHCRWCAAKPVCPLQTGQADRALRAQIASLPAVEIADWLHKADQIEDWIKEIRALAQRMLEEGQPVPGWKLVPKRATRQWTKAEDEIASALAAMGVEPYEQKILSPAAAEKLLKKTKQGLPADMVAAVSSGDTLAPESDPRPASHQLSRLKAALDKVQ